MIESANSHTNPSSSKPILLTPQSSVRRSRSTPDSSRCSSSQVRKRPPIPSFCGTPTNSLSHIVWRRDSPRAKKPSLKNASRGVGAMKLGLPPAGVEHMEMGVGFVFASQFDELAL